MDYDDIDFWYDLGACDLCDGRESAWVLIMLFDGVGPSEAYREGYADAYSRTADAAFEDYDDFDARRQCAVQTLQPSQPGESAYAAVTVESTDT